MVTFKESSFVVEVRTGGDVVEEWLQTIDEMIDALQCEDEDLVAKRNNYLELLRSLMPDWDTAKNMVVKHK